jgi:AcrR family transcriptional regulator
MVEAILEGAIRVLVARGYAETTTIAIAKRAGVSVGSLYQYFPNKDAIVATLIERHSTELVACIDAALEAPGARDPRSGVRELVRAGMDAHRIDPALHKVFVEQVPRVGRMKVALDTSAVITKKIAAWLEQFSKRSLLRDPQVAAFVVETVIEALTHRAAQAGSIMMTSSQLEEETTELLVSYLFAPRAPTGRRRQACPARQAEPRDRRSGRVSRWASSALRRGL